MTAALCVESVRGSTSGIGSEGFLRIEEKEI